MLCLRYHSLTLPQGAIQGRLVCTCGDPESFVRGGPNLTRFFLDEGREDPNTPISRPSSARQPNTIETAFHWRADGGPTLNAGLLAL